jgi:hypothetical protein
MPTCQTSSDHVIRSRRSYAAGLSWHEAMTLTKTILQRAEALAVQWSGHNWRQNKKSWPFRTADDESGFDLSELRGETKRGWPTLTNPLIFLVGTKGFEPLTPTVSG